MNEVDEVFGLVDMAYKKVIKKLEFCHIYGSNCGMCMIAAPYPYCCRAECGTKDYCEGCNYKGGNKWERNM